MDKGLVCNFKKCRKSLTNIAWVTSCSHIFCNDDGSREFQRDLVCPACETCLPGKFDIVKMDLQPSEQYKSMVLAGQQPETIMEVCSRALSFWTYQTQQEISYLNYAYNKSKERNQQLENCYEQVINRTQTEISSLRTQIAGLQKELQETKKIYNEACDKLSEKKRQYQKLLNMYDMQRRKCITPMLDSELSGSGTPTMRIQRCLPSPHNFQIPLDHRDHGAQMPGNAGEPGNLPVHHLSSHRPLVSRAPGNVGASGSAEDFILRPMKSPANF